MESFWSLKPNDQTLRQPVNKIATLRNFSGRIWNIPDVARLEAEIAANSGADPGITIHPRPERAPLIKPNDVDAAMLAAVAQAISAGRVQHRGKSVSQLHGAHPPGATGAKCTLVPDDLSVITSNQGWDLKKDAGKVAPVIAELKALGARVSLFIDPDPEMPAIAKQIGADRVELYTEPYASAFARGDKNAAAAYTATALKAHALGVGLNAGHDLNLKNLGAFLEAVPHILEVSIGHAAAIADALEFGLREDRRDCAKICRGSR